MNMTTSEIAKEIGVSRQTIDETISKALNKLRIEFAKRGIKPEDVFGDMSDHYESYINHRSD